MNPKGSYDSEKSLKANTGIDDPLLSRFDLIFLMLDSNSLERDAAIADHIINAAIIGENTKARKPAASASDSSSRHSRLAPPPFGSDEEVEELCPTLPDMTRPWMADDLRIYIATVKDRIKPILSKDATKVLSAHYSYCRKKNEKNHPVTVRLLESLIRLAQAHARLM